MGNNAVNERLWQHEHPQHGNFLCKENNGRVKGKREQKEPRQFRVEFFAEFFAIFPKEKCRAKP